jgi:hypothetical protein
MGILRKLLSAIVVASSVTGCGFAHDERMVGPYRLVAVDISEQMAVCEDAGSNVVRCVVPSSVFAAGWNPSFIIAKQHPFDEPRTSKPDKTVTNYWIIRVSDRMVIGPLSEADFHAARAKLGVPSDLQFNKVFSDLAYGGPNPALNTDAERPQRAG